MDPARAWDSGAQCSGFLGAGSLGSSRAQRRFAVEVANQIEQFGRAALPAGGHVANSSPTGGRPSTPLAGISSVVCCDDRRNLIAVSPEPRLTDSPAGLSAARRLHPAVKKNRTM